MPVVAESSFMDMICNLVRDDRGRRAGSAAPRVFLGPEAWSHSQPIVLNHSGVRHSISMAKEGRWGSNLSQPVAGVVKMCLARARWLTMLP